jgi:thioredoxin-related protein
VNFKLNQVEIAKTICVQRKMVFNSCNGRCELQKSLKRYTDNEKRMQNNLKEKTDLVYVRELISTEYALAEPILSTVKISTKEAKKTATFSTFTFRPPAYFIS